MSILDDLKVIFNQETPLTAVPTEALEAIAPGPGPDFFARSKVDQVRDALSWHFNFRHDVVKQRYEFQLFSPVPSEQASLSWIEMTDRHFNSIWNFLSRRYFGRLDESALRKIIESDYSPDHDPIKVYFHSLPAWDGKDYIAQLGALVTTKPGQEALWILYLNKWMVASTATMLGRGVNHTALILSGRQGIGKTWYLCALGIRPELTFSGHVAPGDKDAKMLLYQKTLIHLDELDSSIRETWSHLKALITLPQISLRVPYGRAVEDFPRRASFCASINEGGFLSDLTGSRRWLCIETIKINYQKVTPELMKCVYSQALKMLDEGFKYWFDTDDIQDIEQNNQQYHQVCSEEEALLEKFKHPENSLFHEDRPAWEQKLLTNTQICKILSEAYPAARFSQRKLGVVLKSRGFERIKRKDGLYAYVVDKIG